MSKKPKIIIIVSVVLILVGFWVISRNKKIDTNKTQNNEIVSTTINYDDEESLFRVIDDETGEILYEGNSEEAAYLYQIDPTYRPSNPDSMENYEIIE